MQTSVNELQKFELIYSFIKVFDFYFKNFMLTVLSYLALLVSVLVGTIVIYLGLLKIKLI
jgi:hypothetical protein